MARYFKHRDTQPIETYAPINLKFMDEKLKGKQAKTDRVKKLTRDVSNLELSGDAIQKYEYSGAESEDMKVRNNVLNEWREQQKNVTDMMLNSDGTNEDQILDTIYNMKNYKDKMEQGILSRLSENKKQYLDTRKTIAELEYLSNSDKQVKREEMERRYVKAGEGNGLEDSGAYNEYGNYDETKRVNLGNLMAKAGKDINIDETKGGYSRFMGSYIRHDTNWSKTRSPVKIAQAGLMQLQSNNDMLNTVNDFISTEYNRVKFNAMRNDGKTEKEADIIAEAAVANERAAMNMNYYLKDSGKKKDGKAIMELDMDKFNDTYVGRSIKQSILTNAKNEGGGDFTFKDNFLYNQAEGMSYDDARRMNIETKTGTNENENYSTEAFRNNITSNNTSITELNKQLASAEGAEAVEINKKITELENNNRRYKYWMGANYKNNGVNIDAIAEDMYQKINIKGLNIYDVTDPKSGTPGINKGSKDKKDKKAIIEYYKNKLLINGVSETLSNYKFKAGGVTDIDGNVIAGSEIENPSLPFNALIKKNKQNANKAEEDFKLVNQGTMFTNNKAASVIKQLNVGFTDLITSGGVLKDIATNAPITANERDGKFKFTMFGTTGDYGFTAITTDEDGEKQMGTYAVESNTPLFTKLAEDFNERAKVETNPETKQYYEEYSNILYADAAFPVLAKGITFNKTGSDLVLRKDGTTVVYEKEGSDTTPIWYIKIGKNKYRRNSKGDKIYLTSGAAVKNDVSETFKLRK